METLSVVNSSKPFSVCVLPCAVAITRPTVPSFVLRVSLEHIAYGHCRPKQKPEKAAKVLAKRGRCADAGEIAFAK